MSNRGIKRVNTIIIFDDSIVKQARILQLCPFGFDCIGCFAIIRYLFAAYGENFLLASRKTPPKRKKKKEGGSFAATSADPSKETVAPPNIRNHFVIIRAKGKSII